MEAKEAFDSFYASTHRRLLLEAFAVSGDVRTAQAAVRDAYVAAWRNWPAVSRDDPSDWVRSRAVAGASRRRPRRTWHPRVGRTNDAPVLEALCSLTPRERHVLLLVELDEVDLTTVSRELRVTIDEVCGSLAQAMEQFSSRLDVPATQVRGLLATLADRLEPSSTSRGRDIRRAGSRRGRARVLVGSLAALVMVLALGAAAYLYQRAEEQAPAARPVSPAASSGATHGLPEDVQLLDADQIRRLGEAQEWRVEDTGDNTSGTGINSVCQQARFADPKGSSAAVRTFRADGLPVRSAVQTVEVSRNAAEAAEAFRTTVGWYAGCQAGRLQLLNAYRVDNIGDQADVLMLRLWREPVTTMSVAVARTGRMTTTTVGRTVGGTAPPAGQITQSLADAVAMLCASSGSQDCAKQPTYHVVPPPPSGEERGLLAVADLPPVGRIDRPWVGTDAAGGAGNPAATPCDRASFTGGGAARTRSRTYLIPGAALPTRFGLSETYGVFRSPQRAGRFMALMRARIGGCEDRSLATTVSGGRTERRGSPQLDLSSWVLTTKVSSTENVRFRVGFVRVGARVAQVTFAPSPSDDITDAGFRSLLLRSGDRLRELG